VVAGQPCGERGVQGGEGQPGRGGGLPADEVAGQQREQFGGDGPEEPFDLPPALRPGDGAVDEADVQVGADLAQVVAGEVAPVVGVEDFWQAADDPPGVGLRSDGLPQGEGQVQRGRCSQENGVPADRAGAVVDDDRQPGARRVSSFVEDQDVELGVVGLPDLVRAVGLTAVHQLVAVAEPGRAVVRKGQQVRVDRGDDLADGAVRRRGPAPFAGQGGGLAGDGGHRGTRPCEGQSLDHLDQLGLSAETASVDTALPSQRGQAPGPKRGQPALSGPGRDPSIPGCPGQRDAVLHVRAQYLPPAHLDTGPGRPGGRHGRQVCSAACGAWWR